MKCRKCGTQSVRMQRVGFLQRHIYSLAGLFPWRCVTCGKRTLAFSRRQASGSIPGTLSHMTHPPPANPPLSDTNPDTNKDAA